MRFLQLFDSFHDRFFVTRANGIFSVVDIAEGFTEQSRFERTDTTDRILVQERIPTDSHFNFGTFHQVDGWIQLFEFFQANTKNVCWWR
jgi:hypothetical protein